ncbi:MAG: hypothetical protein A2Y12_04315 [Planctomycetes bacterium GWF2_42_9]|nr:MAG: hypothetical protein A2Y12_04315 [Planctomycetes bacterium GWF2_42_9]
MMLPDLLKELGNIQVPDKDVERQAVNALRGYIYQVYETLNTWLTLKQDEVLAIEVAEDFAVIAKDALNAVQVKDTAQSGSVTLRTPSAKDTICSLWRWQQAHPNKQVRITYLTTANIGKEKGLVFPDNYTGLTYWRVAAREGSNVEPIRSALLNLNLPADINDFIKTAEPDELRDRILRKITWTCNREKLVSLDQTIRDLLVDIGVQLGFAPTDSERAMGSLIFEVLKKATTETNRILSRADLLRTFEKAASVTMSLTSVRTISNMISSIGETFSEDLNSVTTGCINISRIPFPPHLIERADLVARLISGMVKYGSLWIHGSSGTGKTVLTQFIARSLKNDCLLVQLRNCCSPREIEFLLSRAMLSLHLNQISGIILDDFPTQHANAVRVRLSMLVNEVSRIDGYVIITSAKAPSPNLQNCFGENGPSIVKIPYLSQEDVAELVKLAGGDAKKWAGIVHSFCGFGHPQLVQARISGLKQRNWPDSELLAGVPGFGKDAEEIESARQSIREQLLSELSQNARDLLYRLTLFAGYFDRDLAITVGDLGPAIQSPGEALDTLLGPWIEVIEKDRFRVSPLVSNAANSTLSQPIQTKIHKQIVAQLLTRRPFPSDFLGALLSHAFSSRHAQGLTWLTMAVMHTSPKDRKIISENLFILQVLQTNQPLFKENMFVSAMLRLAQFRVTAWSGQVDRLPEIADQVIKESRMLGQLGHIEIANGFLCMAISSILVEQVLKISPEKWMPLLLELEQLLGNKDILSEYLCELSSKNSLNGWTIPQFLFAIRATSLKSTKELLELFTHLDRLEEKQRNMYLSSLERMPDGKRLMIDVAWLEEMRAGTLNGLSAAGLYCQLTAFTEKWHQTTVSIECECARSVMLDEYANDSDGALASLEKAQSKYPDSVRLIREHAKVCYHKGNYPTALSLIETIADAIPKSDHIERAYALREAGISAGQSNNFSKSSRFFSEAYEAANAGNADLQVMAIGLQGDQAYALFQLGDYSGALRLLREALLKAEQLNPKAGKTRKYCIMILGNLTLWIEKQLKRDLLDFDVSTAIGCCSNPDPSDKVLELALPPFVVYWYQLAIVESMLTVETGILNELRQRTCNQKLLAYELVLNNYLMAKYILKKDVGNFLSYLNQYISITAYTRENASAIKSNIYDLVEIDCPTIDSLDNGSELHKQYAKDAVLAILAIAICTGEKSERELIRNEIQQKKELTTALANFFRYFENTARPQKDIYDCAAYNLGIIFHKDTALDPNTLFVATYRIWEWLQHTCFKDSIENIIADYFVQCWQYIIENQRFLLHNPISTIPDIQRAMQEPVAKIRIPKLLLAAEQAVDHRFVENLRSTIKAQAYPN